MKITDNMSKQTVSGFGFSAIRPEVLDSSEYTLVTLVLDKSGSVFKFADDLFKIKSTVVDACRKSPRSDYLLLRVVEFNSDVDEVHGFVPLPSIDINDYRQPKCNSMTALYDATFSAVAATMSFAKTLNDQEYLSNGIVIIVTDGDDTDSRMTRADVKTELDKAIQNEMLESMRVVLVGVDTAGNTSRSLEKFQMECGISEFVDIGDATPQKLAKLSDFVSRSISAQSQALGTGGPSQSITF
jgi:hypothetical protein